MIIEKLAHIEGITVIEGSPSLVMNILFDLCISSVISYDKDILFIDGRNSFDPYVILKMAKSLEIDQRKLLSRIHIARAFTEYQMESLIEELNNAVDKWNPYVLIISYLSSLFSDSDIKLFSSIIDHLIYLTNSSCMITVISSHGETKCDKLLASKADKIITIKRIDNIIRINDNGNIYDNVHLPRGQMRLSYG
jgi:hypothetical protein